MFNLTQFMHAAADLTPSATATIFGDRHHSWEQFRDRVARLAASMRALGVKPDSRVAILALNSDRYTEYYLACWYAGAAVVPMNIRWTVAENAYSLNDSQAEVLFVDAAFTPMLAEIRQSANALKHVIYMDDDAVPDGMLGYEDLIANARPCEDAERGGEDLAGLYYTGGTTGFPKGVMLAHRAIWYNNLLVTRLFGLTAQSRYLHAAPMFHLADGAASGGVTAIGGTHIHIPMFDVDALIDTIDTHQVTHVLLVPTMINMLMQKEDLDVSRLASLTRILYGASPMPEGLMIDVMKRLPDVQFVQAYGQTELAPLATVLEGQFHVLEGPQAGKIRSAGRAVPGTEIKIVDEAGQGVARGEVGEIIARGPGTMLGYWNLDEQTASTLIDGWVHTGDGGYLDDDGFVFIADRMKDMIVTGGENVFSAEVESAISKHPAVADVAVVGIPDEKWGEAVHAIIVPREGESVTTEEIIAHCKDHIANYKWPRSSELRHEPLPLSGAGKVLKRDLRAPFWEGKERQVN
jgi:acyl-CoA synthetase (AMP-forming)/AMP-acid ligase II